MPDPFTMTRPRGGLHRTRRALAEGRLTVGYVGTSHTDPRPGHNWCEFVNGWFLQRFPETRLRFENAAIGASRSASGVFRAERDLIAPDCDLVFVEYAVNDQKAPREQRARSREGLIRKLLADGPRDIVLIYSGGMGQISQILEGEVPETVADFETLAEHYHLPSVWIALAGWREVLSGAIPWHAWIDGHPTMSGSRLMAEPVNAFLEQELGDAPSPDAIPSGPDLPSPYTPYHWQFTQRHEPADLEAIGPWSEQRWPHNPWIDTVLYTSVPRARLRATVRGHTLVLGRDYGNLGAHIRWRLDEGPWEAFTYWRFDWAPNKGWFRVDILTEEMPPGDHLFELEVLPPEQGTPACQFGAAFVGTVLRPEDRPNPQASV